MIYGFFQFISEPSARPISLTEVKVVQESFAEVEYQLSSEEAKIARFVLPVLSRLLTRSI